MDTCLAEDHLAEIADLGQPCVLLNREHPHLPWVAADRRQGTGLAAAHLLAQGRSRLGLLTAAYPGGVPADERPELAGFRDALRAAGRRPESGLVRFASVSGDPELATADLLRTLLSAPRQEGSGGSDAGLVVFSYTLGPAAARAIARCGVRVPDDLALVVGDEDPEAREAQGVPGMPATAVTAPKFEMAQAAARLLLKLVRAETVTGDERSQRFPMELNVRWTCGARSRTAAASVEAYS
ncbi:MAG: hypothetical protein AVDCRST_MAG77-5885 [uncultured Chloroflexi bacterium]|uniref:Transcriptional regulator LacI/GalR-like sensor domain-containing protein n=1 Tax=uncultured Chloroflexota bacterium TaxID=166587 RepID=A0A6J4KEF6_9CHLR|nr:MAG: hypothetical protein AVDCRST_MAG77-5885 [uncultured Chloroflexota bacterium]